MNDIAVGSSKSPFRKGLRLGEPTPRRGDLEGFSSAYKKSPPAPLFKGGSFCLNFTHEVSYKNRETGCSCSYGAGGERAVLDARDTEIGDHAGSLPPVLLRRIAKISVLAESILKRDPHGPCNTPVLVNFYVNRVPVTCLMLTTKADFSILRPRKARPKALACFAFRVLNTRLPKWAGRSPWDYRLGEP